MKLFLKPASSRRVGNEDDQTTTTTTSYFQNNIGSANMNHHLKPSEALDKENVGGWKIVTVWRKSLLVSCSGFTVIDCKGNLVYRVDNYNDKPCEIVLMDAYGHSVFTMRPRRKVRLVDEWKIYNGEPSKQNTNPRHKVQPTWYVKKNINILQANSNVLAHVFAGKPSVRSSMYVIEGSYGQRCCRIVEKSSKTVVAEIKRKEAVNGSASFGLDVFKLVVAPGFDTGFAMSLVLLLDRMYG